ncbi:M43 family zinc metalloprotease [Dyadobacter sp. NIV53]|uniref:M43 family zinc metalloprotease n=1 Tax=Dyadobacter sp. NIV53 TaxID=2861765 RepID=UPI001E4FF697|nr:M43 family zinc metalloprotease [Dyadobacter sp. NIV53]
MAVSAKAQTTDPALIRCVTTERDSIKFLRNPALLKRRQETERLIQNYIKSDSRLRTSANEVITIPVIIHVVHSQADNQIGGTNNSNISDEQIQSQIDVLNEDYSNQSGYKGFYTDSLAVDTGIRFKLIDIVRTYNDQAQFSPLTDDKLLATISPPWLTSRYLNIWVCRLSNRYLGVAQFPVVTEVNDLTQGLSTTDEDEDGPLTDGVIIDSRYFGRNSSGNSGTIYNLGRTTTHEVGHWLGLYHIWGLSNCGTDYCSDTPRAENANETTDTSCQPKFSTCNGPVSRNMIENYMDYSPDVCMSVFTGDQKNRMHAALALSPRRAKLVEFASKTDANLTVDIYPNPVSDFLNADIYAPDYTGLSVSIINASGIKMTDEVKNWTYINVKNYPAGIYFLRVNTANDMVTKRFFIP